VFSVEGGFVRHVGLGKLKWPIGVACSACDEIVVADHNTDHAVFSASGEVLNARVAMHGGTVFAVVLM
jgi:hypothetical protein